MIPDGVGRQVAAALGERTGRTPRLEDDGPVGGGCINPSARIRTDADDTFFLKWNAEAPAGMFEAEADGLEALRGKAAALRVPEVVGRGAGEEGPSWLLLEFIPRGKGGRDYEERLGRGMAALHRPEGQAGDALSWGWPRDNWIGSLPQENGPTEGEWAAFWRDRRMEPQLRRARDGGYFRGSLGDDLDRLLERMEEALDGAGAEEPSLLHGDLWGGNVFPSPEDEPVVIDPAVYRGHREVDLAMSELFGFPSRFMDSYREAWPVDRGYDAGRRDLYQLYYLLVHVNLFGAGYVEGCLRAARRARRLL